MKSNYKLKLISALVVLGVSVVNAKALQPTLTPTTITAENSDEWVMVQNENGIKVYFSKYELSGKNYLNIRFENNTNKIKNINWSLLGKNTDIIIKEFNTEVKGNSSNEFYNPTLKVELKNGDNLSNYSININNQ